MRVLLSAFVAGVVGLSASAFAGQVLFSSAAELTGSTENSKIFAIDNGTVTVTAGTFVAPATSPFGAISGLGSTAVSVSGTGLGAGGDTSLDAGEVFKFVFAPNAILSDFELHFFNSPKKPTVSNPTDVVAYFFTPGGTVTSVSATSPSSNDSQITISGAVSGSAFYIAASAGSFTLSSITASIEFSRPANSLETPVSSANVVSVPTPMSVTMGAALLGLSALRRRW